MNNDWSLIDQKFGSVTGIAVTTGTVTLTVAQSAFSTLRFTGALTGNVSVVLPAPGFWSINNATTGGSTLNICGSGGDSGVTIPQTGTYAVSSDGTNAHLFRITAAVVVAGLGYTPANKAGDTFTGAVAISSGGLNVTGGSTIAGGETISSGNLTVSTGNLTVTAGGLTVTAGNLQVTAGSVTVGGNTILAGATATTPTTGDNSTNVATTAFVNAEITNNIPAAIISISALAIGSFINAATSAVVAIGSTTAGSNLTTYAPNTIAATSVSGTWRCLGTSVSNTQLNTLWLRVA